MPVDRERFAEIMSSFPSGVTIVTTLDETGVPKGLTSSAVASVSADPPLLLVCVDFTSRTLPALRAGGRFLVNFMRAGTADISRLFASKSEDKFAEVAWRASASGMPHLHEDAIAWAECVTVQEVEAGDHVVLLGSVEAGTPAAPGEQPLVYYRRAWGAWAG
jgi:flavin reductase (DIM6/NTAB) family NADH-FMN oxidoreductase RutF